MAEQYRESLPLSPGDMRERQTATELIRALMAAAAGLIRIREDTVNG